MRPRNLQLETLRDNGLQGHGPLTCVGVAAGSRRIRQTNQQGATALVLA